MDNAQRKAIRQDELEYEARKGNGLEIVEVLKSLSVLGHQRYLSEKVIHNHLMDQWWDLRYSPGKRPIYLDFTLVHEISTEAKDFVSNEDLGSGAFGGLYRSVAPKSKHKWVCFFLFRNQGTICDEKSDDGDGGIYGANHFFPVVFDYEARTVHCFGISSVGDPEIRVEAEKDSGWKRWRGPQMWQVIATEMGWSDHVSSKSDDVTVVTKNWPQVGLTISVRIMLTEGLLYRMATTVECTPWTFSAGSSGMTGRRNFWTS